MARLKDGARRAVMAAGILALLCGALWGQPPDDRHTLSIRLVHPEQQAAEILRLFEGARAPHPAAALAAWKRSTRDPAILGKPIEALITAFNPETAREWRVLDGAELRLDLNAADGRPRWHAVVPHDDGTLSAAVTAMRLTGGADEAPLAVDARPDGAKRLAIENRKSKIENVVVERLGPPGAIVAARAGETLVLASSRSELVRGFGAILAREGDRSRHVAREKAGAMREAAIDPSRAAGVHFELDPGRLAAGTGPLALRRAGELLRGLACRQLAGRTAIEEDCMILSVITSIDRAKLFPSIVEKPAAVEAGWLKWIPSVGVTVVVSIAIEPGAAYWDWAFALADRVERIDPERAGLAPLRTRANLFAAAASVRPEADLWPHLRGVTACLLANAQQPGTRRGGLLALHVDTEAAAERLAGEFLPRLANRYIGKTPVEQPPAALPGRQAGAAPGHSGAVEFNRLGTRERADALGWTSGPRCARRLGRRRAGRRASRRR